MQDSPQAEQTTDLLGGSQPTNLGIKHVVGSFVGMIYDFDGISFFFKGVNIWYIFMG